MRTARSRRISSSVDVSSSRAGAVAIVFLSFRRKWIGAVAVAFANPAIATVDQQFARLALCDRSRFLCRLALRLMHRGRAAIARAPNRPSIRVRSEEHTSELQSLMRISYAVFCLKKKKSNHRTHTHDRAHY